MLIITSLYSCSPWGSYFAQGHFLIKENVFFCATDIHPDLLAEVSSGPAVCIYNKWVQRGKVAAALM